MKFLITGAGRGIGLELAIFALEGGHEVVALVRDPSRARNLEQARKEYPNRLKILACDVCKVEDLDKVKEELKDEAIDVLINNAGVMMDSDDDFEHVKMDDLEATFHTNTFAPLRVTQIFLRNLKKSPSPKLINITSKMGSIDDNSSGGYYAYRMSKTALNMFSKSFSIDYPDIVCLTLHPGWVRTQMGGPEAPLLPRESARGLYKVITEAKKDQTGQFLDYQGKLIRW